MISCYFIVLEALKIVRMLWQNPLEGERRKELYEQQIGLLEVLLEAVPTAFVTTILMEKTLGILFKIIMIINTIIMIINIMIFNCTHIKYE